MEGSIRLAPLVHRYFSTAIYLIFAELRFQIFCRILYYKKRPRIIRNDIISINLFAIMFLLASLI